MSWASYNCCMHEHSPLCLYKCSKVSLNWCWTGSLVQNCIRSMQAASGELCFLPWNWKLQTNIRRPCPWDCKPLLLATDRSSRSSKHGWKVCKATMQLASFDEAKWACREIKNQPARKPKRAFNESCCNEYGCVVFAFVYTAVHQMKLWAPVPLLVFKSNLSSGRSKDASKTTLETPLGEPFDASMLSHFKHGTHTASSYWWITYYYLNPNEPSWEEIAKSRLTSNTATAKKQRDLRVMLSTCTDSKSLYQRAKDTGHPKDSSLNKFIIWSTGSMNTTPLGTETYQPASMITAGAEKHKHSCI